MTVPQIRETPQTGEIVWTEGRFGSTHWGIVSGADDTGQPWIIHNVPGYGVEEVPLLAFITCKSKREGWGYAESECRLPKSERIAKARALIGKDYDLFRYNCEHFIYEVCGNEVKSPGIQFFAKFSLIVLAFCAFAVFLMYRKK